MADETIVAVYDTAEHAAAAVRDLEAAGVPSNAITQHAGTSMQAASSTQAQPREQGFWSSLFGGEPDRTHDAHVYDRSIAGGSTVVTVRAPDQYLTHTMEILERHNPIDIDERASTYGVGAGSAGTGMASAATGMSGVEPSSSATARTTDVAGAGTGAGMTGRSTAGTVGTGADETLSLSEESVVVGKRAVNRGTTRVRRYVVETPVEENVRLREETVSIERRPVAEGHTVTNPDFTDKVVEVTETAEEAVVSKTARVREEVVVHKGATERTETIHDTVRREDVEVTKDGTTTDASVTGNAAGTPRTP